MQTDLLQVVFIILPFIATHTVIITLLHWIRIRIPVQHRQTSNLTLVLTALPLAGPLVSAWALSRLALDLQGATAQTGLRSDCGYSAGIGYGLTYAAASWVQSPDLGVFCLALLLMFFWQARGAIMTLPCILNKA